MSKYLRLIILGLIILLPISFKVLADEIKVVGGSEDGVEYPAVMPKAVEDPIFFPDVAADDARYEAVYFLGQQKIIAGYPDGEVKLKKPLNRAEFVKILLETKKYFDPELVINFDPQYSFKDVDPNAWYAEYVSTAKRLNVVQGYADGSFKPEQEINYPEAFKVIIETLEIEKTTGELPYPWDQFTQEWFAAYLNTINSLNLSDELSELTGVEVLGQSILRGSAFDTLYRAYFIKSGQAEQFFYDQDVVFGDQNGIIHTGFKSPYYLPIAYRGAIKKLEGHLYQVPLEVFLETQVQSENEECCMVRNYNRMLVNEELVRKMELVSTFETEIQKLPGVEENGGEYLSSFIGVPIEQKGLYLLRVNNKYLAPEDVFIVATDLTLLERQGGTESLGWLINSRTSLPIAGAEISYYKTMGKVVKLGTEVTNQEGIIDDAPVSADLVVARHQGDLAILTSGGSYPEPIRAGGIEIGERALLDFAPDSQPIVPTSTVVYAYSDRPIYRPGDQVQFKGIVREIRDDQYTLPIDSSLQVRVKNYNAVGEVVVYEQILSLSTFGTFISSFDLPEGANTGQYNIYGVARDQEYLAGEFVVEAYQKREYELMVHTTAEHVQRGDEVTVAVTGQYFFDQPLANKEVTYRIFKSVYVEPSDFSIDPVRASFLSGLIIPYATEELEQEGSLILNEQGQGSFKFTAGAEYDGETPANYFLEDQKMYSFSANPSLKFRVEVAVMDESNLMVQESTSVIAHNTKINIFIEGDNIGKKEEKIAFKVLAVNHQGEPYRDGANLVYKIKRFYGIVEDCGQRFDFWENKLIADQCWQEKEEIILESTQITDYQGEGELTFTPTKAGQYRLEVLAYDDEEKVLIKSHSFYVAGVQESIVKTLNIYSNQLDYEYGETINLSTDPGIKRGTALVTIAQDDFIQTEVVKFTDQVLEYSFVATNQHVPSVQIYIDIPYQGSFISGEKHISVFPSNKKLNIELKAEREQAAPGETIDYLVKVTDSNQKPVATELSFALVDKAIFQIRGQELDDILKSFYAPRYYWHWQRATQTRLLVDSFPSARGESKDGAAAEVMMDKAMEAPREAGNAVGPAGDIRKLFLDTAAFIGQIETNASGEARIPVTLPDNLTTWTGVAVGVTKNTELGTAETEIFVQSDFMLRPHLPRFATVGDKIQVSLSIHSKIRGLETFQIEVNQICVEDNHCLPQTLGGKENVKLREGESTTLNWEYLVPDYLQTGEVITFQFKGEQADDRRVKDEVQISIPVYSFGQAETVVQAGEDDQEYLFSGNDFRQMTVYLSPSLAYNLTNSLSYLVGYPYGCTEQTLSKFIPNIVAYQARNVIDFGETTVFNDLPAQINSGLQKLYAFQHEDGGWGWWKDDLSQPRISAYVVYGLTLTKAADFAVDENVYTRALDYLEQQIENPAQLKYYPYLYYVLSQTSRAESYRDFVVQYLDGINLTQISSIDVAYLLLGNHFLGVELNQEEIKTELLSRVIPVGQLAYIDEGVIDYENMESRELATAVGLEALVFTDFHQEVVSKLIRYLNQKRTGFVYHETHATAHAILAFVDYLKKKGATVTSGAYRLIFNGIEIKQERLNEPITVEIDLDQYYDPDQENKLQVLNSGDSDLYSTVVVKKIVDVEQVLAVDNGFSVSRRFLNMNDEPVNQARAGEVVKVELKVDSEREANYVMIMDPIPAGFEVINPQLEENINLYDYGYFSYRNFYDNHVAIFVNDLYGEEQIYSYYLRAVRPGVYKVNPTQVEMMYMPEINGRGESGVVTVK